MLEQQEKTFSSSKFLAGGSPGGPEVRNVPSNAGDMGSIPGWGFKIPRAAGQLSLCATTKEACTPQ